MLCSFEVVVTSDTGLPDDSTSVAFSTSLPASSVCAVMRVTWSLNTPMASLSSSGMDLQPLSRVQSRATAMTSTVSLRFIFISSVFFRKCVRLRAPFSLLPHFTIENRRAQTLRSFYNCYLFGSYSAICPFCLMTSMTPSTYFSQISSEGASTMTRMTGSVPLSRTRMRPVVPSSSPTLATAAWTSGSF